jgi:outer membrane protein OmpA-like peptidoglycan-associated protein
MSYAMTWNIPKHQLGNVEVRHCCLPKLLKESTMLPRNTFALVCALFAAGCASSSPKQVESAATASSSPKQVESVAKMPPAEADGTFKPKLPNAGHYKGRNHTLAIRSSAPVQCRFSPHFALGSSEPMPQDMADLEVLADCMNSEQAKDRSIEIVGHADINGSSARNMKLSLARAERIRDILAAHGVKPERMQVRSVGERAALGYLSGYSNGFDRRVDVTLVFDVREPVETNRYDIAVWR